MGTTQPPSTAASAAAAYSERGDGATIDGIPTLPSAEDAPEGFVSRLWAEVCAAVLPFADPELETKFVEFSVPTTMILQVLFLFGMAAQFLYQPLYVGAFTYDWVAMCACGLASVLTGAAMCFIQRRGGWNTSLHAERAWLWVQTVWCIGDNAANSRFLLISCLTVFPFLFSSPNAAVMGGSTMQRLMMRHQQNATGAVTGAAMLQAVQQSKLENMFDIAVMQQCHEVMLEPYSWNSIGVFVVGIVRVRFVLLFYLADLCFVWGLRWALYSYVDPTAVLPPTFTRPSPVQIFPSDAAKLFDYFFYAVLLIARERGMRQRFLVREELLKKMEQSAAAKAAVESMMATILPPVILSRLMAQESTVDTRDNVSVLFSDIQGFTDWSSKRSPMDIVRMLNCMYRRVDLDLTVFGVEKVTTIGDAYWAVCGLPPPQDSNARLILAASMTPQAAFTSSISASSQRRKQRRSSLRDLELGEFVSPLSEILPPTRLVAFGLEMQRHVAEMRSKFSTFSDVQIRVGVATGTATGGVVGSRQLAYQIFGPVNIVAESLEQLAPVGAVLVCPVTKRTIERSHAERMMARRGTDAAAAAAAATEEEQSPPPDASVKPRFTEGPLPECFLVEEVGWMPYEKALLLQSQRRDTVTVIESGRHAPAMSEDTNDVPSKQESGTGMAVAGSSRSSNHSRSVDSADEATNEKKMFLMQQLAANAHATDAESGLTPEQSKALQREEIREAEENINLAVLRERLSTPKYTGLVSWLLMTFQDDAVEAAYGAFTDTVFAARDNVGIAPFLSAVWLIVSLIAYAAESAPPHSPHAAGVFSIVSVLFVFAVLFYIFAARIHPIVSWIRTGVEYFIQLVMFGLFLHPIAPFLPPGRQQRAENPTLFGGDPTAWFLTMNMVYATLGSPSTFRYWWWCLVVVWVTMTIPTLIWSLVIAQEYNWQNAINVFAGPMFAIAFSAFRLERDRRAQFVDGEVATTAEKQIREQRKVLSTLLSRAIPHFALPELIEWLGSSTKADTVVCHHVPHAAILFFSVPEIGHYMVGGIDPVRAFEQTSGLVALYDACIESCNEMSAAAVRAATGAAGGTSTIGGVLSSRRGTTTAASAKESAHDRSTDRSHHRRGHSGGGGSTARSGKDSLYGPQRPPTAAAAAAAGAIKVKTIGDIVLVAAGLHRGVNQPMQNARFQGSSALVIPAPEYAVIDLLRLTLVAYHLQLAVKERYDYEVIGGIHSGPVVSGILGDERLVYDVFGDTVNTASRVMTTTKLLQQQQQSEDGTSGSSSAAGVWVSGRCAAMMAAAAMATSDGATNRSFSVDGGAGAEMSGPCRPFVPPSRSRSVSADTDDSDQRASPVPAVVTIQADNNGGGRGQGSVSSNPVKVAAGNHSVSAMTAAPTDFGITVRLSAPQMRAMKGKGEQPCFRVEEVLTVR